MKEVSRIQFANPLAPNKPSPPASKKRFKRSLQDVEARGEHYRRLAKRQLGRRTKLTPEMIESICVSLSLGHHPEFACAGVGLGYSTFMGYLKKGKEDYDRLNILEAQGVELLEKDYSLHFDLFVKTQQALFEAQNTSLKTINSAVEFGDWKAAAHLLERRFPKQWARKSQREEVTQSQVNNIQTIVVVPKRAESLDEWGKLVNDEKAGKLVYQEQQSEVSTSPKVERAALEDMIGIQG
jgi:hypothetical protein